MVSILNASLALALTAILLLARPVVILTAWDPGLWVFHRYREKRNFGISIAFLLSISVFLGQPEPLAKTLIFIAGVFALAAVLLNPSFAFPALQHVVVVPAAEVTDAQLETAFFPGDTQVIVVEVDQERRAYPLRKMVVARHLVHDFVGETPVLVSFCALCNSSIVFQAAVQGKSRLFSVVGVFRRNLIMEDHLTQTLWQQATGTAIHGKEAGASLMMLPSYQLSWEEARKMEGMTLALEPSTSRPSVFSRAKSFELLEKTTQQVLLPGQTALTNELEPHEIVYGIQVNGISKAYPLSRLTGLQVFTDRIGRIEIELAYDPDQQLLLAKRNDSGENLIVERHWWLGWKEFHPDTTIYRK